MVVGSVPRRRDASGPSRADVKKKFSTRTGGKTARKFGKKIVNLSRKQIVKEKKDQEYDKMQERRVARKMKKAKTRAGFTHLANKKANRAFDHETLKLVHDSLNESIEVLGEKVTPLSLFACGFTALENSPNPAHIPYLLAIITAVAPKVSTPALMSRMGNATNIVQHLLAGNDNLASSKAIKMIQAMSCAANPPTSRMLNALAKLEPNKLNASLMSAYIATLRKFLQNAFQEGHVEFFMESLPDFVETCVNNFIETKDSVANATKRELVLLFDKTLTPKAVEFGAAVIDKTVSILCSVYKAHFKEHWALVADVIASLFSRLSFIKRTPDAPKMQDAFPAACFLLRVLDKIRQGEDATLNPSVTKAIVSIASCMRISELLEVIPFDPQAEDVEDFSAGRTEIDPWARSYLMGVIRQTAGHDSLPFFVEYFLPRIKYTQDLIKELQAQNRLPEATQWMALETQYWRIAVGFSNHPVEVTGDSFRNYGRALVTQLTTPMVDIAAQAFAILTTGYHRLANLEEDQEDSDDEELEEENPFKLADEDEELLALTDDGWSPHVFHNISRAYAQEVCQTVFAKYSMQIMPKLCNIMETHDTTAVMQAIQGFSKVCSGQVMNTILQGILDLGSNIVEFPESNQHQLSSKRRVVLDIAYAIAGQLSIEHLQTVYENIIEPVLSDAALQNRLLQKKAYKLLFALFDQRLQDILPYMPRIVNLLTMSQQNVTVSGLKMRVKCLSWCLDAYKMYDPSQIVAFVKQTLPEVIMFSRERSSGARELSMAMLERMYQYSTGAGQSPTALIQQACAGLAGKTPMLVSATIVSLAKLVWVAHQQMRQQDLARLISMISSMLEHTNTEVRTAAATFLRMLMKTAQKNRIVKDAIYESLGKICQAVAIVTSQSLVSSATRVTMRILTEKCIKLYGLDECDKVFPIGSKRFLQYVSKMVRRADKREEKERRQAEGGDEDQFGRFFMGKQNEGGLRVGDEDEDDADGDLLTDGALRNFVAERSALPFGRGNRNDDEEDPNEELCMETDEEGKIRIMTKEQRKKEQDIAKRRALADKLLRRGGAAGGPSITARDLLRDGKEQTGGKRKRDDVTDYENEELLKAHGGQSDSDFAKRYTGEGKPTGPRSGMTAAQKLLAAKKSTTERADLRDEKRKRMEADVKTGEEFGTDKGFGDVKKGNVDPFAYVPLNRKFLNKRNMRFADKRLDPVTQNKSLKGAKAQRAHERLKKK